MPRDKTSQCRLKLIENLHSMLAICQNVPIKTTGWKGKIKNATWFTLFKWKYSPELVSEEGHYVQETHQEFSPFWLGVAERGSRMDQMSQRP